MRQSQFDSLVAEFVALDGGRDDASDLRPGRWTVGILGLALTSPGLAYEDGYWAQRFLERVDTRAAEEMAEWDRRSARAWLLPALGHSWSEEQNAHVRYRLDCELNSWPHYRPIETSVAAP